jgi:hypothetical protein
MVDTNKSQETLARLREIALMDVYDGDGQEPKPLGAFEELAQQIERLLPAQGGWWIDERDNELVIHTHVSRDPSRSSNGGEYDFYDCFAVTGDGILVYEATSCELRIDRCGRDSYAAYTIPCVVGLDGLRRIAALVGLRAACKQFLRREIGFADLKAAVGLAE